VIQRRGESFGLIPPPLKQSTERIETNADEEIALPEHFDLRTTGIVPPILFQLSVGMIISAKKILGSRQQMMGRGLFVVAGAVNGAMSGTEGQALRLEGIELKTDTPDYHLGLAGKTHIENLGWGDHNKLNILMEYQ